MMLLTFLNGSADCDSVRLNPCRGEGPRINQSLADSVRAVSLPLAYWRISGRMSGRTRAG